MWGLSICLFHVQFGLGECRDAELGNTARRGAAGAPRRHHVIAANDFPDGANWTDPADGPLYAEATRLFRAALDTHGVDEARCRAMRCVR